MKKRFIWRRDGKTIAAATIDLDSCTIVFGVFLEFLPNALVKMRELSEEELYPNVVLELALQNSARFQITKRYNWNSAWRDFLTVVNGWLNTHYQEVETESSEVQTGAPVTLRKEKSIGAGTSGIYQGIGGVFTEVDGFLVQAHDVKIGGVVEACYREEFILEE